MSSRTFTPRIHAVVEWTPILDTRFGVLYGGNQYLVGVFTDLWRFNASDPARPEWALMGGDPVRLFTETNVTAGFNATAQVPAARSSACSAAWVEAGHQIFVTYGGAPFFSTQSSPTTVFGDFNLFNLSRLQWTALPGGRDAPNQPPVFGTYRQYSSAVYPGALWSQACSAYFNPSTQQTDFYQFGGLSAAGTRAALWQYSLARGQWRWLGGDSTIDLAPNFGLMGVLYGAPPPPANGALVFPGVRYETKLMFDSAGLMWVRPAHGPAPCAPPCPASSDCQLSRVVCALCGQLFGGTNCNGIGGMLSRFSPHVRTHALRLSLRSTHHSLFGWLQAAIGTICTASSICVLRLLPLRRRLTACVSLRAIVQQLDVCSGVGCVGVDGCVPPPLCCAVLCRFPAVPLYRTAVLCCALTFALVLRCALCCVDCV